MLLNGFQLIIQHVLVKEKNELVFYVNDNILYYINHKNFTSFNNGGTK